MRYERVHPSEALEGKLEEEIPGGLSGLSRRPFPHKALLFLNYYFPFHTSETRTRSIRRARPEV